MYYPTFYRAKMGGEAEFDKSTVIGFLPLRPYQKIVFTHCSCYVWTADKKLTATLLRLLHNTH